MAKSQADAIREILRENPGALPAATAKLLRGKGYRKCQPGTVSSVKCQMRRVGEIPSDSKDAPRSGAPKVARSPKKFDKVSLSAITATKSFVDQAGGVDKARKILDDISEMGGVQKAKATLEAIAILTG